MLHVLGLALVVGRCSHAYGVSQPKEVLHFRKVGVVLPSLYCWSRRFGTLFLLCSKVLNSECVALVAQCMNVLCSARIY
ncbi:hypothetical protein BCT30_18855 [Enterovibrio norvegicus]|uniref:Uncharacterized protein n=1 Tax=Enterovibrio norvegicus DSM 15893 TaxID=1121869 RepID=A0A1I5LTI0_9GAMM|nr:hypothetical protein A1OS_10250 [Enterovibrio norvegicus]SFP00659.1 hypothetical protein SAMN03084138_01070 [Enterovibrio norvegicus DSM 15893]OEF57098.1 hypothetical protein A1OU_20355 [Enterovibrio norvegicus]PMI33810.1 hypothetical protein BCU47_08340 [Enterovibrio norvegicus]PMI39116.1 hypothetical protein BCU46_06680 [Enterovibrio norvegicus]